MTAARQSTFRDSIPFLPIQEVGRHFRTPGPTHGSLFVACEDPQLLPCIQEKSSRHCLETKAKSAWSSTRLTYEVNCCLECAFITASFTLPLFHFVAMMSTTNQMSIHKHTHARANKVVERVYVLLARTKCPMITLPQALLFSTVYPSSIRIFVCILRAGTDDCWKNE
jgi:hypothetical protein